MYLFVGTRGAETRVKIILSLSRKPSNTNQLANELGVDYKAMQYQLGVLQKNKLIETPVKESYGALYFLTPLMEKNLDYVKEIWSKYGESKINEN